MKEEVAMSHTQDQHRICCKNWALTEHNKSPQDKNAESIMPLPMDDMTTLLHEMELFRENFLKETAESEARRDESFFKFRPAELKDQNDDTSG